MRIIFISFLSILFFSTCSTKHADNKDNLNDQLYLYKDLKRTTEVVADRKSFTKLDSTQKRALLPDITKGQAMDLDFPYSTLLNAYFVSKQKTIGAIQPIILKLFTDDFDALVLICLNSKNTPVDFFILDREEFCGSNHETYCEKSRHSILNGNEILTYDLYKVESSSDDKFLYTDSIVYKSSINADGKIKTLQTDSVRILY